VLMLGTGCHFSRPFLLVSPPLVQCYVSSSSTV
jgi:hypothetical protein